MSPVSRHNWIDRAVRSLGIAGVLVLLLSVFSFFGSPFYQQPPAMVTGPAGPGAPPGTVSIINPGGQLRIRLLAGSLIVANGSLPPGRTPKVLVTLGFFGKPGLRWFWYGPAAAWSMLLSAAPWEYHFYREHVQVQLIPVGLALVGAWALRRWVFKRPEAWQCQQCRYDRRGIPSGPCPECGLVPVEQGAVSVLP